MKQCSRIGKSQLIKRLEVIVLKNRHIVLLGILLLTAILISGCNGESNTAQNGNIVQVHYTGTLQDGTMFDTSVGREPLEFTLGEDSMIQGFEEAVLGMRIGESKTVTIPVEEAYGPHNADMTLVVNRDELPEDISPEVGQQLQMTGSDGGTLMVVITEVSDTTVTLDANHPLAGKDLTFEIELVSLE
jgi:FKBP-type peptidyl-prolyl cis-trans isomerase 2